MSALFDRFSERPWKGVSALVLDEAGVQGEGDLVRIPYRDRHGVVLYERVFAPSGRAWFDPSGIQLVPFGLETLPPASEATEWALLIAEGESDALALREAFAGVEADCPHTGYAVIGMPGASTWRTSWRRYIDPFPNVYLVGDGDAAGRAMMATIFETVTWGRVVFLPDGEDARSILQRDGARALDPYLDDADRIFHLRCALAGARDVADFEALLRRFLGEEVDDRAA